MILDPAAFATRPRRRGDRVRLCNLRRGRSPRSGKWTGSSPTVAQLLGELSRMAAWPSKQLEEPKMLFVSRKCSLASPPRRRPLL